MDLRSQLPVIIRYIIATAFAALATHGLISAEVNTILSQNLDAIVGALGVLGTVAYALWRRPSSKALEVAKQVDESIPAGASAVVRTPSGQPDIVVHPK
jgi:type VI protein secretion system component VasF